MAIAKIHVRIENSTTHESLADLINQLKIMGFRWPYVAKRYCPDEPRDTFEYEVEHSDPDYVIAIEYLGLNLKPPFSRVVR